MQAKMTCASKDDLCKQRLQLQAKTTTEIMRKQRSHMHSKTTLTHCLITWWSPPFYSDLRHFVLIPAILLWSPPFCYYPCYFVLISVILFLSPPFCLGGYPPAGGEPAAEAGGGAAPGGAGGGPGAAGGGAEGAAEGAGGEAGRGGGEAGGEGGVGEGTVRV